jgi:murein DD-endopeptidase MepM/ murein hydrolase activator NlpD
MRSRAQAYGIDFAKVGGPQQRELTRRTPAAVADFYAWGAPILAPADGEVVAVVNDLPDNPIGVKDTTNPAGNQIVLRIAANRYVFLAHAQRGSITVEPGASVQRGMPIAACGNSGNSDFPHIHLHIQDAPTPGSGTGQNPVFGPIDVELTGKRFETVTWPLIRGLFVSNP